MKTVRHLLELKGYDIWSIPPDATVLDALKRMAEKDVGVLMVMEGEKLVGVISERDYARKIILFGKASKDTLVKEIMSTKVISVHPDQTVDEAMVLMSENRIRHLPVVIEQQVIGVISINDVVRSIMHRQRETIKFYEDMELEK
jgi:CBS domain-containing protein